VEFSFYFNKAQSFLDLAGNILDARIAAAKGDHTQAISYWEKAVPSENSVSIESIDVIRSKPIGCPLPC